MDLTKRKALDELLASDEDSSPDNSESEEIITSKEFDEEGGP